MSDKLAKACRVSRQGCEVDGWCIDYCCTEMREHFAPPGGGGWFCVKTGVFNADGSAEALGIELRDDMADELPIRYCPFCGAAVEVME